VLCDSIGAGIYFLGDCSGLEIIAIPPLKDVSGAIVQPLHASAEKL
jgi:hypothetical protein